jgi:hypothetical protein
MHKQNEKYPLNQNNNIGQIVNKPKQQPLKRATITKEDILKEFELYRKNLKSRQENVNSSISKHSKSRTPIKVLSSTKTAGSATSIGSQQQRMSGLIKSKHFINSTGKPVKEANYGVKVPYQPINITNRLFYKRNDNNNTDMNKVYKPSRDNTVTKENLSTELITKKVTTNSSTDETNNPTNRERCNNFIFNLDLSHLEEQINFLKLKVSQYQSEKAQLNEFIESHDKNEKIQNLNNEIKCYKNLTEGCLKSSHKLTEEIVFLRSEIDRFKGINKLTSSTNSFGNKSSRTKKK